MTTKKLSVRDIALIGLFTAIIIIQTYTPLGYISVLAVSITLIHITVILAACLLGARLGALVGGIWGVTSMIYAFQSAGVLNPIFYNPLVSVLPRILVGFIAGLLFRSLFKRTNTATAGSIAAFAGTLTNTVLVLSGMYFFGRDIIAAAFNMTTSQAGDPVLTFIFSLVGLNTLLELAAAVIIVPALLVPLKKLTKSRVA